MILDYLASKAICSDDLVVVSPDVGGVARARAFAKKLSDAPLAIVDKRRQGHNVAEVRPKENYLMRLLYTIVLYFVIQGWKESVHCSSKFSHSCFYVIQLINFMNI